MKGGLGGSPNDIFDVMQGSIYAYILCMALACRMYYDIYSTTMKSKALRGDPTRRIGKAKAFAAANFAELRSFRRGWMALRASRTPCNEGYMTLRFFLGLGIAVVLYIKLCDML